MPTITRQSVRAILVDHHNHAIFLRRTKPGHDPYTVTVGGGVESTDACLAQALQREVQEEIGGVIANPQQVYLITEKEPAGIAVQHVFLARLVSYDLRRRTGSEVLRFPESYETCQVPFSAEAIHTLNLKPHILVEFITANLEALSCLAVD